MRALNVTVADLGPLAGRLRVGDSVDVYASFVRNAAPVLLAARVLSVGASADDGAPDTANAMLAVRPEDALRFVAARQGGILTAMLRHRDDAVAVGDEDLADPAALQACPPNPLRRAALSFSTETGRMAGGAARATDTTARPTGRRMALNRYRLAAMLGLCGCLAGVQAQTIPVELEVGKAGCCPIRACGAWRSATGRYCARPTPTGRKSSFWPRRGRVLGACLDGRWTAHRLCVQSRAGRARANAPRSRRCSRAFRRPGACVGGSIVIEGDDLSDQDRARIAALAERYPSVLDLTGQVGWDRMVLLDVQVVEIPTSRLREFGLKWDGLTRRGECRAGLGRWLHGASGAARRIAGRHERPCFQRGRLFRRQCAAGPAPAAGAQRRQRDLSGWRRIYVSTDANGRNATVFKPYGVSLKITPRIDRNDVIRSLIEVEASSVDTSLNLPGGPALRMRRASTEFNVRSGSTLVIGGFLSREQAGT